jgi:hypothetical protein
VTREPDYVRIWADDDGESHFEDVHLESTERQSPGATSRVALSGRIPVADVEFRRVLEEASYVVPHNAPERLFIVTLTGRIEVEVSDGEVRRFGPGDVCLVEDTHGKGHITRSLDPGPRRTLLARPLPPGRNGELPTG